MVWVSEIKNLFQIKLWEGVSISDDKKAKNRFLDGFMTVIRDKVMKVPESMVFGTGKHGHGPQTMKEEERSMDFGYIRVSSRSQSYARQLKLLQERKPDIPPNRIYLEKKSGSSTADREELKKLLNTVREGDRIYVTSIDRLGRNLMDVLQIVRFLDGLKVGLISISQGIDSGTPTGKMFIMFCGLMAEMELLFIRERASEGIGIAKGKKRLFTSAEEAVLDDYLERRKTATESMELLRVSHSTFFRRVSEYRDQIALRNDKRRKEIFEELAAGKKEILGDRSDGEVEKKVQADCPDVKMEVLGSIDDDEEIDF